MNTLTERRFSCCNGFTIVELLVALGLAGLVLAVLVAFFANIRSSTAAQNATAAAQQAARTSIDYIVQELRYAGLDPKKISGAGIEEISANGNKLRFTSDRCDVPVGDAGDCVNPVSDGDVDDKSERVTFTYDAAARTVRRCLYETAATHGTDASDGTCQPLVEGVVPNPGGVPVFTFLNEAGNPVIDNNIRSDIRTVVVTLTIEEPAGGSKTVARTYSSRVRLRNIGL
jgi:prepilin-type N-terminal cleavage/methylation domain-containing protein